MYIFVKFGCYFGSFSESEIRTANMLAIKGAPADNDTQTCCLSSILNYASIYPFFMSKYFSYTRPSVCLLSEHLTQIWPGTLNSNGTLKRVTKNKMIKN